MCPISFLSFSNGEALSNIVIRAGIAATIKRPGKVRPMTLNDDSSVIESVVLCAEERYGVDMPKGIWHKLESGRVVFVCKEGAIWEH